MSDDVLSSMSISELKSLCKAYDINTALLMEKKEFVAAVRAAQDAEAASEAQEAAEAEEAEMAAEEEALRQALLMSEESETSLRELPVAELRSRCHARGISTVGLAERADLVAALLGSDMNMDDEVAPLTAASSSPGSTASAAVKPSDPPGVEVLCAFADQFWCQAWRAEDEGASLDPHGGKVLLPHSCLAAIAMLVGGALPATLLLRLSHMGSSVYVSVADWVDDRTATRWLRPAEALPRSGPPTWGPAGALAAVFVPRWVRGSLGCNDGDKVQVALVSLPKASGIVLQPQTEAFAMAVSAMGDDPLAVLTPLFNRFPAVAAGDVLSVELFGERHAIDVLAVRGLPHVRCGRPESFGIDVAAALASVAPTAGTAQPVRAACIVDADVEVDFTPSCEAEGAEERTRQAAALAEVERRRQVEQAAADAAAKADVWSVVNLGAGHRLGGGEGEETAAGEGGAAVESAMNEREKRLAALQRRGL